MQILRKIVILMLKVAVASAIVALLFWFTENRRIEIDPRNFQAKVVVSEPEKIIEKKGPKEVEFSWTYDKKNYFLAETLYSSAYEFYKTEPKEFKYQGELPAGWKEKYFSMFMVPAEGDDMIPKLAADLRELGIKNRLNPDQIVEFVLAFVQAIPYDDEKAKLILSGQGEGLISYPYEVLYENKGVCSDKSFLAAALLQNLGYGTALLVYENDNHMALGIRCTEQYSAYGSGYCYAETTAVGSRIGMIPDLSAQNNQAQAEKKLEYFESSQNQFDVKRLGPVEIYAKTEGKTYAGIKNTVSVSRQIDSLKAWISKTMQELKAADKEINSAKAKLTEMEDDMKKYLKKNNYEAYNKLVEEYNDLLSDLKKDIKAYNSKVNLYNEKVKEYNSLIGFFQ